MKKIKTVLLLIFGIFLISMNNLNTQSNNNYDEVAKILFTCVDEGSSEKLKPYLASGFKIKGMKYKGFMAKLILNEMLKSLETKVLSNTEKSIEKTDSGLLVIYNVEYETLGKEEATILLNKAGKIKELSLFQKEIKVEED